mmetsp:Transcript_23471/g.42340  ORF Transcript_23471/g.42340 Transcript_23471/m.42340 type:complete len:216 (+) Transcript_23471:27-674(+)
MLGHAPPYHPPPGSYGGFLPPPQDPNLLAGAPPAYGNYPPPGMLPHTRPPLTVVAGPMAFSGESTLYPWYRVQFLGGLDLRQGPSIDAPRTGLTLSQNSTFAAAEELLGPDGRLYLRLADGRGWAFDDSALYPHDPAVVRGFWSAVGPGNPPAASLPPVGIPTGVPPASYGPPGRSQDPLLSVPPPMSHGPQAAEATAAATAAAATGPAADPRAQ